MRFRWGVDEVAAAASSIASICDQPLHDFFTNMQSSWYGSIVTSPSSTSSSFVIMIVMISVIVVMIPSCFVIGQRYVRFWSSPLWKIPGPERNRTFLFGSFFEILKEPFMSPHKKWIQTLSEQKKKANDSNKNNDERRGEGSAATNASIVPPLVGYSSLFGSWSVLVLDCDIVQEILLENYSREPLRFPKRYNFLKQIAGDGLAVLEGEKWSRHRRILQPCFQLNLLRENLSQVVPHLLERFMSAWQRKAANHDTVVVDIGSHMSALTLDILGHVSFLHDFHGVSTVEKWADDDNDTGSNPSGNNNDLSEIPDPLIQSLTASFKITALGVFLSLIGGSSMINVLDGKAGKSRRMLDEAAGKILENARAKTSSGLQQDGFNETGSADDEINSNGTTIRSKSLLQQMLGAKDKPVSSRNQFSEKELREEIASFVVAGHDTTSTWCMWAFYALGLFPDIQERVYADIMKHASSTPESTTTIPLEEIEKMDYFLAFLSEVLRFYSPVGMIIRFTAQTEIWHGYTIPPNTRLCIPIHLIHRHADHWEKPEEFCPDRWLDNDGKTLKDSNNSNRHKFAFIPFSAGPRNCIGNRLADLEAKLILANLIRTFHISLDESTAKQGVSFTIFIAMKSKLPIKIRVVPRRRTINK